jgi:hypothetical protein
MLSFKRSHKSKPIHPDDHACYSITSSYSQLVLRDIVLHVILPRVEIEHGPASLARIQGCGLRPCAGSQRNLDNDSKSQQYSTQLDMGLV